MALTWEEQGVYEKIFSECIFIPPPPPRACRSSWGERGGDGSQQVMSELYGTLVLPGGLNWFWKPGPVCGYETHTPSGVKGHACLCDRCPGRGSTREGRVLEIPVKLSLGK